MGIEIQKKIRKEIIYDEQGKEINNPTPEQKKAYKERLRLKKEKEVRDKEDKKVRELCLQYHKKLDKAGYFNSSAMEIAKDLLPQFLKLKTKLLTKPVQLVVRHRIAYMQLMVALGKRRALRDFVDKFSPEVSNVGVITTNRKKLEEKAKKSKEFQALKEEDFIKAISAMKASKAMLKSIVDVKGGNFGKQAVPVLQNPKVAIRGRDGRVDDFKAAKNLYSDLDLMIKNVSFLKRKREILKQT